MKSFRCLLLSLLLQQLTLSCEYSMSKDKVVRVAAASSMQYAVKEIASTFEKKSDIKVEIIFASSGKLTAQIIEGAPYDVFISADTNYPEELYRRGLASGKPKAYGYGKIVLWSTMGIKPSLNTLEEKEIKTIAIANPKIAPYGLASLDVLRKIGLLETLNSKIVYGESINQTNNFITSKAVEVGFTSLSTVLSPQMENLGLWTNIDPSLYRKLEQSAVLLNQNQETKAKEFYEFLYSDTAKDILRKYGL